MWQRVFGYVIAVVGCLAIIGSLDPIDFDVLIGGILYLASGLIILSLTKKEV